MFYRLRRTLRRTIVWSQRSRGRFACSAENTIDTCICCGSASLKQIDILWPDLIDGWGLDETETLYLNRQQGFRCGDCGARTRSMALADWMIAHLELSRPLAQGLMSSDRIRAMRVLEINEAGQLTKYLAMFGEHVLGKYPDVDMQAMQFESDSFDLVIHSDTLEHVPDPVLALRECRRVLKPGGACAFTIPIVADRMSRSTDRRLATYHGHSGTKSEDFRVRTEFGADAWRYLVAAGFRDCRTHVLEYPAGMVQIGIKT